MLKTIDKNDRMSVLFKMFTDLIKYQKIVHLNIDL